MKRKSRYAFLLAAAAAVVVLAGCSGTGSGTGGSGSLPSVPHFLYVPNGGSNTLSAFSVDATTGALTSIRCTACSTTSYFDGPTGVAMSPNGDFLYVANYSGNTIAAFKVGSDGSLTAITCSACSTTTNFDSPTWIGITPNGDYLYVADGNLGAVAGFSIDQSSGALTALSGSPFPVAGTGSYGLTITPNGSYLYITNNGANGSNGISGFTIGSDGALTAITSGSFSTGTAPMGVAVSPNSEYLYVANSGSSDVSAFSIGSGGALKDVSGSNCGFTSSQNCFATGNEPYGVAVSSNGDYLYVTDWSTNAVSAFSIDSGSGALSSTTSGGSYLAPWAISSSTLGSFLYVLSNVGSPSHAFVSALTIGSKGALTQIGEYSTSGTSGSEGQEIAITP